MTLGFRMEMDQSPTKLAAISDTKRLIVYFIEWIYVMLNKLKIYSHNQNLIFVYLYFFSSFF